MQIGYAGVRVKGVASWLIVMLVGAVVWYVVEHVHVSALIHSVGAAVLSGAVVSLGKAVLWLNRTSEEAGIAAVSFGIAELLMAFMIVAIPAIGIHFALGWAGRIMHPSFVAH